MPAASRYNAVTPMSNGRERLCIAIPIAPPASTATPISIGNAWRTPPQIPSDPISATMWKPQAATTAARLQRALAGRRVRTSKGSAASSSAIKASGSFEARIAGQLNHGGLP